VAHQSSCVAHLRQPKRVPARTRKVQDFCAHKRFYTGVVGAKPLILLLIGALLLAGCGASGGGGSSGAPEQQASRCTRVPRALLHDLQASLNVRGKLRRAQMVKSREGDKVTLGSFQRHGAYAVSARLDDGTDAPAVLTWLVGGDVVNGNSGAIVPAEAGAQKWSEYGADLDRGRIGASITLDGVYESRDCAGA
jgi:hypothetical protein